MTISKTLSSVIDLIDQANAEDPNTDFVDGERFPKELLYSQRMSSRLASFSPGSPDTLKIAAHAQHIQRWKSPRNAYPMTRPGYLQWRRELGKFHAETTTQLMAKAGYDNLAQNEVANLLTKQQLKTNPMAQTLEDVICLVFIEYYLADFAAKHTKEKLFNIIKKTWNKMSDNGHKSALELPLRKDLLDLIVEALKD